MKKYKVITSTITLEIEGKEIRVHENAVTIVNDESMTIASFPIDETYIYPVESKEL